MSRGPALDLALRLLDAARELERTVGGEDPEAVLSASEARASAFRELRSGVGEMPPTETHAALREVREIDQRVLARVPGLQDEIRRERELLGVARDAARAVRQKDAPRFLDLRA